MPLRAFAVSVILAGWFVALSDLSSTAVASDALAANPPVCLWIDPRPLAPAADPAAEQQVFEQTFLHTVDLFLPVGDTSRGAISLAAAAFAARKPVFLRVNGFASGSPTIEYVAESSDADLASSVAHRQWADSQRGGGDGKKVLELFVDVDALRRAFEPDFAEGAAGRVLHALHLPNARSLVLHGRWIAPEAVPLVDPSLPLPPASRRIGDYKAMGGPPIIRIDLSWNARADAPTVIRGVNIAAGHWPRAQLPMDPPAAPFLCLFRANWRAWLDGALAIRAAWHEPAECPAFEQACTTWLRTNRAAIDRVFGSVPTWLVVHPDEGYPERFVAQTPLRAEKGKPDPIVREVDNLIRNQFKGAVVDIRDGGSQFRAPAAWPICILDWNPSPRPPRSTVQFRIDLRGGRHDGTNK